jgi:hypothetical protein
MYGLPREKMYNKGAHLSQGLLRGKHLSLGLPRSRSELWVTKNETSKSWVTKGAHLKYELPREHIGRMSYQGSTSQPYVAKLINFSKGYVLM